MKKGLQKPANWQDFEDLCYLLWKFIWKDRHTRKNGRQGQAQNGVDVYGRPDGLSIYEGVQCKGKADWADAKLTFSEIKTELKKAMNFRPGIKILTFATTAPSDASLLEDIREIDTSNFGNITPQVQSWEEIEISLRSYPEVLKAFYTDSEIFVVWKRIGASSFEAEVKIEHVDQDIFNLMMSEMAKIHINNTLRFDLKNVVTEIAFNAAKYSKSECCVVNLGNKSFSILCDGAYHDLNKWLLDPSSKTDAGWVEISNFLELYKDEVSLKSEEVENGSLYTFGFKNALSEVYSPKEPFILNIDTMVFRGRLDKIIIPADCKRIVLPLSRKLINLSNLTMMLDDIVNKTEAWMTIEINQGDLTDYVINFISMRFCDEIASGKIRIIHK